MSWQQPRLCLWGLTAGVMPSIFYHWSLAARVSASAGDTHTAASTTAPVNVAAA